jgi:hypothetical protein
MSDSKSEVSWLEEEENHLDISHLMRQLEEKNREVAFGGTNYAVITMAMTARMSLCRVSSKSEILKPFHIITR